MDGAASVSILADELERELSWLRLLIERRFHSYFAKEGVERPPHSQLVAAPPEHTGPGSAWAELLRARRVQPLERLALVLALAVQLRPHLLDVFFTRNATFDRPFTEFGGIQGEHGFEPTGETLAFLVGACAIDARIAVATFLSAGLTSKDRPLVVPAMQRPEQPLMKAPLRAATEVLQRLSLSACAPVAHNTPVAMHAISTTLTWSDLVLHPGTQSQLEEIETFLRHGHVLLHDWGMATRLRPGYRALFYGPPGTGKTLSASLLGKLTARTVYRVDLSLLVSKYVGETTKNLARIFDSTLDAILFFDEADALFGKRGETKDAHDRYANQEVAYLLQRIESHAGVVILASNLRQHIDDAFSRRFESVVYFPLPRAPERLRLWRQGFSDRACLARDVDLERIAVAHELAGGSIMNVIRRVSLAAIAEGDRAIQCLDIERAVRRELSKEGRSP
jgi:AAA+ superfamily predicted ATPase